ncbi:MAG: hypothetical protein DLM59_01365 [Pseudonocardiales bacterium]|nr:MAG: hypothetical protein DLM59_01365 [Pseudonocardiales bacterium]
MNVSCNAAGVLGTAVLSCTGSNSGGGSSSVSPGRFHKAPSAANGKTANVAPVVQAQTQSRVNNAALASRLPTTGSALGVMAALALLLVGGGMLLLRAPGRARRSATHRA